MLAHFMKMNQGLIAPGQKQVTPLQAKLHYMKIVSELRSFGGKCFLATLVVSWILFTSGRLKPMGDGNRYSYTDLYNKLDVI